MSPKSSTTPPADEPMQPCGVPEGLFNSDRWRRVWEQLLAPLPEEAAESQEGGDADAAQEVA